MAGDIHTTSGSKFYISTAAAATTVDTLTEFAALTYTEVGLVEDLGEVGDVSTEVTGAAIGDGRVRKAKGARNAGTQAVIAFRDPLDAGQIAVIAAEATSDNYAFKLVLNDKPSGGTKATTLYYRGLVMSKHERYGTNDNITRRVFNIGVNSPVTEDLAA